MPYRQSTPAALQQNSLSWKTKHETIEKKSVMNFCIHFHFKLLTAHTQYKSDKFYSKNQKAKIKAKFATFKIIFKRIYYRKYVPSWMPEHIISTRAMVLLLLRHVMIIRQLNYVWYSLVLDLFILAFCLSKSSRRVQHSLSQIAKRKII